MRNSQQEADGVVGEVIFPNTIPPFFPSFVLFAPPPKPEDYVHRLAGVRAHNRWLVDFCGEFPDRRAGIGQIFLNDIDDAITEVRWIKEHGLRGGLLLPNIPPDVKWVRPLYDPAYDRLWEVIQELDMPINVHGGTGRTRLRRLSLRHALLHQRGGLLLAAPLRPVRVGRSVRTLPPPQVRHHRDPVFLGAKLLSDLDATIDRIRKTGQTGEIRYGDEHRLDHLASEYFAQSVWMGVSQPRPADVAVRDQIGAERFMWGSDYPHDEGTYPFTRETLRQVLPGIGPDEKQRILGENCAKLYQFDLAKLAPLAATFGPTVEELDEPLDRLPENPNEALRKSVVPS